MEETDCFQCQHNSTFEILLLFHAHTWYLTRAMYKTARIGKWLSRRKKNDFHISYLFHFPIHVRFLSLPMVTLKHKGLVTFLLYSLAISLIKCFSFDPLLCGNRLLCSINSLIQSIYDLKVKFILIPTTIAIPFPPLFDSKRESVCVIWCKTVQTVQWAADFCPSRRRKVFPTLTLHLLCDFLDLSFFFFFKIKW